MPRPVPPEIVTAELSSVSATLFMPLSNEPVPSPVPVIVTVVDGDPEIARNRIESGASVLNVSAGKGTPAAVAQLRTRYPELPLLATGGKTGADIEATVAAGANAVICTPPSNRELFSPMMERYRGSVGTHSQARELRPLSQVAQDEIRDRVRELRDGALASGLFHRRD